MNVTTVQSTGQVSADQLQSKSSGLSTLSPNDFIKLMVTELQNQDPTKPESSDALLSQMSQIGQLQSSDSLQTTLAGFAQQNQIGAAAALIGKNINGLSTTSSQTSGVVTSVNVASTGVTLSLSNGDSVPLANVTTIAPTSSTSSTAASSTTSSATSPTTAG